MTRVRVLAVCAALALMAPAASAATQTSAYVFFNSLCGDCKTEAPAVASWAAAHPRVRVVAVAFMETKADGQPFARDVGWPFPVYGDPHGTFGRRLGVHVVPRLVLVRAGHIVARWRP